MSNNKADSQREPAWPTSAFSKLAPQEQRVIRREAAKLRMIINERRGVETPADIVALARGEQ